MIWHYAGVVGVDPQRLTLRQLERMARGRLERSWDQTAAVMALLAELQRDKKKRRKPYDPRDFHPLRKGERRRPKVDDYVPITVLKDFFIRDG